MARAGPLQFDRLEAILGRHVPMCCSSFFTPPLHRILQKLYGVQSMLTVLQNRHIGIKVNSVRSLGR